MTAVFDALSRILVAYEDCFEFEDYQILWSFIQAVHDLQHEEGSHRIDSFIEQRIYQKERFRKWMNPFLAEDLLKEVKTRKR